MMIQKLRGLITKHGPARFKQAVWDREFASGKWGCLNATEHCSHPEVEWYAKGGAVLDLGCGPGRTGLELRPGSFSRYLGVDISSVAVETARQQAHGRDDLTYAQGDLMSYIPPQRFDVILLGDSLYYVPLPKIPRLFHHYKPSLTPRGVFIVRVCDPTGRYQPLLQAVRDTLVLDVDRRVVNDAGVPVYTLVGHQ